MSLPNAWIDRIFERLTLAYGRDFLGRWEGISLGDVKTHWSHELSGFDEAPECIAHALQNLPPSRPPTVYEFRELCRKAPRKQPEALPAPAANPERLAAELRKLNDLRNTRPEVDRKQWARDLIARHKRGEQIRPISLKFAREALRLHLLPSADEEAA